MTEDERGKSLHDRASRGETLTNEERQFLDRWYAKMDLEELVCFNLPKEPETIGLLKTQINAVVARLDKTVNRIQQIVILKQKWFASFRRTILPETSKSKATLILSCNF